MITNLDYKFRMGEKRDARSPSADARIGKEAKW